VPGDCRQQTRQAGRTPTTSAASTPIHLASRRHLLCPAPTAYTHIGMPWADIAKEQMDSIPESVSDSQSVSQLYEFQVTGFPVAAVTATLFLVFMVVI
jgi:hypothetical protein